MEDEYQALLNRALEDIPEKNVSGKRFELPSPTIRTSGKKTLILNFTEISSRLNRDSKEVLKFMVRELATAGNVEDQRVIFQGKFSAVTIHRLLDIYTKRYVICPVCRGLDTKIIKENKFNFLLCEACGAKSSIVEV